MSSGRHSLLGEVEKAGGFYINFYFKNIEYDDGFYGDEFSSHNSNVYCEFLYDRKAQEFIDIWNMASNHQDDYWPQEVAELLTRGWEVYTRDPRLRTLPVSRHRIRIGKLIHHPLNNLHTTDSSGSMASSASPMESSRTSRSYAS